MQLAEAVPLPMNDEDSREAAKPRRGSFGETSSSNELTVEEISALVVDCAFSLHRELGSGLLESVYEVVLANMLEKKGLRVERQVPVPVKIFGMSFEEGFRADLIVNDSFLVELKSVEKLSIVATKQTLTYLTLLQMPLGLLINFGAPTFRDGCQRIVNNHQQTAHSQLRINQQ